MFDRVLRPLIDPPLNAVGRSIAARGITPDRVTLTGLGLGLLSAVLIAFGHYQTALVPMLLGRVADGLDGAVARAAQKSDFGGYLDIVADFAFYGAVPFAFAFANPDANATAAAFLLLSFYVNGASFLGYAILAEKHDMETAAQGEKSLYYSNGLLEGTETIVFFVAICVWPHHFPALSWAFGAACLFTAVLRVWGARRVFSK